MAGLGFVVVKLDNLPPQYEMRENTALLAIHRLITCEFDDELGYNR